MSDSLKILPKALIEKVHKRGYFFLSTGNVPPYTKSPYWIDLYSLSHLFNASKESKEHKHFLKKKMLEFILHQKSKFNINSVIIPRWTRSTEDLFTETLLHLCFELVHEFPEVFENIAIHELFNAGNNNFYLNPVYTDNTESHINAVAFLALDIHFGIIKKLQNLNRDVTISSVLSVVGRCDPELESIKKSGLKIIPIFNACIKLETNLDEFHFIMNKNTQLFTKLFVNRKDYQPHIPFEKWEHEYSISQS